MSNEWPLKQVKGTVGYKMMSIQSGSTKMIPLKSTVYKVKYESNLNSKKPALKMESQFERDCRKLTKAQTLSITQISVLNCH